MSAPIRIAAPKTAKKGEVIELKALIQHDMESGYRRDEKGEAIKRNIITGFECIYNGAVIFSAEFLAGVAANPILTFYARAEKSGKFVFRWTEETGTVFEDSADITVT